MPAIFYILYSASMNKHYIGHTTETLEERIHKHNSNHQGFTGKKSDWKSIYFEVHLTKRDAYERERQVKKWKSRRLIEKLIGSGHPDS